MEELQQLFGGKGNISVYWARFYRDWTPIENVKMANEKIGWIIDLMLLFIARTLTNSQPNLSPFLLNYTHDYTIHQNGTLQNPQPRGIKDDENKYVFECYLVTIVPNETCGLIWRDKDSLEVFLPFELGQVGKNLMNKVISNLLTVWRSLRNPQTRFFKFPQGFFYSNIWIPYFACLRLTKSFEAIETIFNDSTLKNELEQRALDVYHNLGQDIGLCLQKNPLFPTYFAPNATKSIALDQAKLLPLANDFSQCKLKKIDVEWFDGIVPLQATPQNWQTTPEILPFLPVADAINPRFFF